MKTYHICHKVHLPDITDCLSTHHWARVSVTKKDGEIYYICQRYNKDYIIIRDLSDADAVVLKLKHINIDIQKIDGVKHSLYRFFSEQMTS